MHFTVLSALALPQDIPAAASSIPVGEVIGFIESKFLLAQLFRDKAISPLKPDTTMFDAMRWEYLAELMVVKLLASYNENNEDITYMELDDRTNEGRTAYEQSGVDCVKTLDGRIIPCHNYEFGRRYELYDGKVYRRRFGPLHHRKQTKKSKRYLALPDYPFRKLFPTAEVFMTEYWGCVAGGEAGHYGYYFNPNGQWDWWQIGGRWPFRFLVRDDCPLAVVGEPSHLFEEPPKCNAPAGYRWVAGARKCDVAWDVMREYVRSQYIEQFRRYEEWFNTGAIPQEYASGLRVAEDGIVSYGDYLYHKGENLEHYLANLGLTDQNPYPIRTCAYVDADGWRDNGWMTSDLTEGERQAWHKEVSDFIAKQPDDALLVSVDCHT
jgi:hypothetical protein